MGVLIGLGVDVNAFNRGVQYHATPLHNAVCSGSFEAVRMLVESGAKVDAKDTAYQATPLTWAEDYLRQEKGDDPAKQYAAIVTYLRKMDQTDEPRGATISARSCRMSMSESSRFSAIRRRRVRLRSDAERGTPGCGR